MGWGADSSAYHVLLQLYAYVCPGHALEGRKLRLQERLAHGAGENYICSGNEWRGHILHGHDSVLLCCA